MFGLTDKIIGALALVLALALAWQTTQPCCLSRPSAAAVAGDGALTAAGAAGGIGVAPGARVVSAPCCAPTRRFCCARLPWALRAKSGSVASLGGACAQLLMQALLAVSGLALPNSRPGHSAWSVVMPLRLGRRACTSAMFLSDSVKSSGTTLARLSRNAVTAYTSSAESDLGSFQGMARWM